ncbi:MAG TPA: DUF3489 domain-containing protein [Novosphingobium sp.]|nr:DUF3489 domain-containing protein [Novosphingobium sp.]
MTTKTAKPRRMARGPDAADQATTPPRTPSKLDQVEALLLAEGGASIAELMTATGWQQHSVRGAMAGALKKRGLTITSEKLEGLRRYRAEKPA